MGTHRPHEPLVLVLYDLYPVRVLMRVLVVELVLEERVLLLHVVRAERGGRHALVLMLGVAHDGLRLLRGHRPSEWNKRVFIEVERGRSRRGPGHA
jgi:hypothetical protein